MNINEDIIIDLTQKLLKSIDTHNWETYVSLTSENISCIEAESSNKIMIGLDFHKFFFEKTELCLKTTFTSMITEPHVKIFGNTALIAYIRKLVIHDSLADEPITIELAETRVWNFEEKSNSWKMVHFHKS
jgi:calcium/calmodulin-dependent protein kinase (CaM kinase) II